jgi:hypothetical protein
MIEFFWNVMPCSLVDRHLHTLKKIWNSHGSAYHNLPLCKHLEFSSNRQKFHWKFTTFLKSFKYKFVIHTCSLKCSIFPFHHYQHCLFSFLCHSSGDYLNLWSHYSIGIQNLSPINPLHHLGRLPRQKHVVRFLTQLAKSIPHIHWIMGSLLY